MKISIRVKLFTIVSCLILFYVALSLLLNNFLLEKYYFYSKENMLLDCYRQIDGLYQGDPEAISLELERLEFTKGTRIVIFDKSFSTKYSFELRGREARPRRMEPNFPNDYWNLLENLIKSKAPLISSHKTITETGRDNRLNTNFVRLFAVLNNGDYLHLSTPVTAIQESAEIANKFFLLTGIFTILTGSLLVYYTAGRLTKPILTLSSITKKMATLDFESRYSGKSSDEIGQLGESINSLSEHLQKSISELKEANEKLKEDNERKQRIDEMRKEFISSVSHELKTPIALVQGYAEGLKLNVIEDEESKNYYCDTIIDESGKMNKLVKQLLELSQLESGMLSLDKKEFNISELAEHVLKKNSLVFKQNGIHVSVETSEDITVNADFDKIEQALSNFINNAVNHVDEQKTIKVRYERIHAKARITVFNSGKHIPEDCVEKIWSSFYKVDKARTRAYGGFGLGLSIVRAIQEAHGNRFGVDNVENGVVFWFELDAV